VIHTYVTSLFFFLTAIICLSSCAPKSDSDKIHTPLQQEFQDFYDNKSLSTNETLNRLGLFLKKAKTSNDDTIVYRAYLFKTSLHAKAGQKDSALFYSHALLERAKLKGDPSYMGRAYTKLGVYTKSFHKLSESFEYYNEAYGIHKSLNDSIRIGENLLYMANIQKSLGDYTGAKETAVDGLIYLEKTSEIKSISSLYHNISIAFREQKNYDQALTYNEKVLALARDSNAKKKIGKNALLIYKNTKANILANQQKFDAAISLFNDLLQDPAVQNNAREQARIQSNLGYVKWVQSGRNHESETLLLEALKIRQGANDVSGLIASNVHLSKYYLEDAPEKALHYAEAALENADKRNSVLAIKEALALIIHLKSNSNDEAKRYTEIDKKITDINQKNRDIYSVGKFENNKLTQDNLILEATTAKKEKQNVLILSIMIAILLFGTFLILYLRAKNRRNTIKEGIRQTHLTEGRLAKKIHDELANDMSDTMNYVDNHLDIPEASKTPLVNKLENLYFRTRDISTETADIDLEDFPQSLKYVLMQHNAQGVQVIINPIDQIDWNRVPDYKKIVVYRCLQELMINMKKHSSASQVTVIFKNTGSKNEIRYTDNGVGFDMETLQKRGLHNVETRMQSISGTFSFDTTKGNGFKARLHFST